MYHRIVLLYLQVSWIEVAVYVHCLAVVVVCDCVVIEVFL